MALTEHEAGNTTALVLNTDVQFGANITTAGFFKFDVDLSTLALGEIVFLVVKKKVRSADAGVTEIERICIANGPQSDTPVESRWYDSHTLLQFFLRQEGGSVRTPSWSISKSA